MSGTSSTGVQTFTAVCDGFAAVGLRSEALELVVTPELGACIVSLRSLRSGREWLWRPPDSRGLFTNSRGDAFERSPLTGAVECVPTIAPCAVSGRELPDHGEAWTAAWDLDEAVLREGVIRTSVRLPVSELEFNRSIRLAGSVAHIEYLVRNPSPRPIPYLWAFHPLLRVGAGDNLELPESAAGVRLTIHELLASLAREPGPDCCAKLFADFSTGREAWAALCRGGERLEFRFDPSEIPFLGLWFTHGGWHGFTHLAIEPSNAAKDSLREATDNSLGPFAHRAWKFEIGLRTAAGI